MNKLILIVLIAIILLVSFVFIFLNTPFFQSLNVQKNENCLMGCMPTFEKKAIWAMGNWADQDTYEKNADGKDIPRGNDIITVKDLSTGKEQIVNSNPAPVKSLGMYENTVVWVDNRKSHLVGIGWTENWTMYSKDIATGVETELMPSTAEKIAVYKEIIAFREGKDLYFYDQNAKIKALVATNIGPCIAMDDYKIIYSRILCEPDNSKECQAKASFELDEYNQFALKNDSANIYLYDLINKTTKKIDTVKYPSEAFCPSINQNKIAYRNENDIYLHDLSEDKTTKITNTDPLYANQFVGKGYLRLIGDKLKYYQTNTISTGPDIYSDKSKCVQIDLRSSKQENNLTCSGGIRWLGPSDPTNSDAR